MSANIFMLLNNNEVVGHSTDTVFGLIAKVDKNNIKKLNSVKKRDENQPLQILFNTIDDALKAIEIDNEILEYLKLEYNSNTSYIAKATEEFNKSFLIDSFKKTLMFRIPSGEIQNILKKTKMLFASSANKTNEEPVKNLKEFKEIFPNLKGFGSEESKTSSRIMDLTKNKKIIRE